MAGRQCHQCQHQGRVGAFYLRDSEFYCKHCWKSFPRSQQCPCTNCSKVSWGNGKSRDTFTCEGCATTQVELRPPTSSRPPSSPPTSEGTGSRCCQCRKCSANGYPSTSAKGAFFCSECWKGFPPKDRMPCSVCHTQLPGYNFSSGSSAAQFMCSSCIGVFVKRRNEEFVLQKQKDEDQALLSEVIDFSTMMKRAGCLHLDSWILKILGQLQLTDDSIQSALEVIKDVQNALLTTGNTVEVYGSRRTGLVISGSDFDLFVKIAHHGQEGTSVAACGTKKRMDAVVHALKTARTSGDPPTPIFTQVSAINARVPIVRCLHTTGASLDFSFSPVGVLGSRFLCGQLEKPEYHFGRPLIVLVKTLLKAWGCDDANNGGLGSFAVAMMVLWFLRQCHEQRVVHQQEETDHLTLAVLLMNFFDYFANKFESKSQGFDVLEGKVITQKSKYCKSPGGICIRHPIDRDENAANGCDKFLSVIQPTFRNAAVAMNHLARMKYLMTTSDIYGEMEQLIFLPVRQLLSSSSSTDSKESRRDTVLRSQNCWLDSHLYCGGFGF